MLCSSVHSHVTLQRIKLDTRHNARKHRPCTVRIRRRPLAGIVLSINLFTYSLKYLKFTLLVNADDVYHDNYHHLFNTLIA